MKNTLQSPLPFPRRNNFNGKINFFLLVTLAKI